MSNIVTLAGQNPMDKDLYFVRTDTDHGVSFDEMEMGEKKSEIVIDIIEGQYEGADFVGMVNFAKGISKDVTEEFFEAVKQYYVDHNTPSDEMLEEVLGYSLAQEIYDKQCDEGEEANWQRELRSYNGIY